MQQYASAFHFLSAAINLQPRMGELYMLLAGEHTPVPFILSLLYNLIVFEHGDSFLVPDCI